jgi:hypothetical protein
MPTFSLRGLILLAIATFLIVRMVRRFGANRPKTVGGNQGTPSSGNAFCTNCGAALPGSGLFCGGCGARISA